MSILKKLSYIFDRRQKVNILRILVLIIIGTCLEMIGVTALYPFINIAMDSDSIAKDALLSSMYSFLGFTSDSAFLIFLSLVLIMVYVIKNIFLIFMNYSIFTFNYSSQRKLATYLTEQYLREPYVFFTKHNSAELIRNIKDDTMELFDSMVAAMELLAEAGVSVALFIYLLYKDKTITIIVGVIICFFIGIVIRRVKGRVELCGKNTRDAKAAINKWLLQTFGGIKEIKASNKGLYFSDMVDEEYNRYAKSQIGYQLMQYVPKPLMEMVCICAVLAAIIFKLILGVSPQYFVSTLAVFAVAAFRLLPSFNRITGYINRLSFGLPSVDAVYNEIRNMRALPALPEQNCVQMNFNKSIEIANLSFKYEGTEKYVLRDANLLIPKNKSVAFIGPSGAGKTTMVDIILGLLRPSKGIVSVDGCDILSNVECWQELIGYVPQNIYLLDDTVANNICFGDSNKDLTRVKEALSEAQLLDYVSSLDNGLDTIVGERGIRLSGGQRQRIGIARALYNNPQVLIFDEATSALDNDTEAAVMDAINALKGKKTLVIVAHRLSTIECCDIVYKIENQTITQVT